MSLNKVRQVKKDKGFKIFDLVLYGVILVLVAVLFIVVFTVRDSGSLSGVRITVEAQTVFEYKFDDKPNFSEQVTVDEDEKGLTVTIKTVYGENVVYIDKSAKSAKMISADCKGGQCMYFPVMNDNSKVIYCNPHRLRVEPFTRDYNDHIIPI